MKNLRITVNGVAYDVQVEELGEGAAPAAVAAPAPASAPKAAPKAAPAGVAGGTKVTAPMPGTILAVNVSVGQKVEEGQAVAVLEAMKMENEIPAPCAGTVASINVDKGASVETGAVLITLS
ncbi:MAG: biotin/lipoyl-binding protein [Ruminococcaceae bacterium]|nr:biotin/lipoyl-binding protein [Oscillospiraceae bacterium]